MVDPMERKSHRLPEKRICRFKTKKAASGRTGRNSTTIRLHPEQKIKVLTRLRNSRRLIGRGIATGGCGRRWGRS